MAVNTDDLSIKISVESQDAKKKLEDFNDALSEANKIAGESGKGLKRLESSFSGFGAGLIVANQALDIFAKIQGSVAKAIELTTTRAIKLESSIARISTILTPTEKAQLNLNEAILGMRAAFGTDIEQIAGGLYESIDNNAIGAKNSILFLNEAQKLAIATGKSLSETSEELGRVIAAYGMSAEDAAHASDVLLVASREGSVGIDQLIKSTSQMSDVASQAGVSFEEFTFGVAALTTSGLNGQKATAYLTEAITAIITPAEDMKNIISSLGFESGKSLIQTRGLAGAIELISSKTDGSDESLKNLFGTIKVGSSVVQLGSGKMRESFEGMFKTVADGSLTTQDAFEKMSKTTEQSMKVMEGRVDVSFTKIGQSINAVLLPGLISLGNSFATFAERIAAIDVAGLAKNLWDLLKVIGFIGVAIEGTLLAMGAGTIVIGGLAASISAAAAASIAFVAAWAPVIIGVGAVVVALDLLIANFNMLIGKQKEFSGGFFGKVLTEGKKLMFGLGEETKKTADEVKGLEKSIKSVGPTIENAFGGIGVEFLKKASEGIKSLKDMTAKYTEEIKKLASARGLTGDSEMQKIEAQRQFGLEQIRMIETQAQKAGILTAANKTLIKDLGEAKKAVNELAKAQRIASINASVLGDLDKAKKDLADITIENEEAGTKVYSIYKNQFDVIKDQANMALKRNQLDIEKFDLETKSIQSKRDQLILDGASTDEVKKVNDLLKERSKIREGKEEKAAGITDSANGQVQAAGMDIANTIVGAMGSGANALVGQLITSIGSMFGPIGQLVAGLINVFRNGYDFMKNLGKEFVMIIVELPMMIADGVVGLVDGILEAVVNTLADPEKLGKILMALTNLIPRVISSIASALPRLLKTIFSVKFWADLIKNAFVSFRDGLFGMFGSIAGMFKNISKNITTGFVDGVKAGMDTLVGFGQKVFSVVADVAGMASGQEAGTGPGKSIEDTMKKAGSWWAGFVRNTSKFLYDLFWGIIDIIGTVMDVIMNVINLVFSIPEKLFKAFVDIVIFLWDGIKALPGFLIDGLKGLGEALWGAISSLGEIVKVVIIDPILGIGEGIWNGIKSIGGAITDFFKKLFGDSFNPPAGKVESWAGINIPILTFAEGGHVPGKANVFGDSLKNDTVPALLSPGEFVLPRSITQNEKMMKWIMSIIETGKPPETHFKGLSDVGKGFKKIGEVTGVNKVIENVTDVIPDNLKDVYTWVKDNLGKIDVASFLRNPFKEVIAMFERAIGGWIQPRMSGLMESLIGGNKFHEGGLVGNYAFGGEVPAMLQSGEFVMNRRAVSNIGESNLGNMNLGRSNPMGDTTINIDLKIDTEQPIDEAFIRSKLIPSLKKELRESSLRGEFVLSQKGLRS